MTNEETAVVEQSAVAHKNYEDLLTARMGAMANTIVTAKLLTENNENSYWKVLGYDSFEEFLAIPELKFKRSKAYDLIGIYKLYCQELGVDTDRLLKAGTTNLSRLMRRDAIDLVRSDTDGWISKAESLTKSDFAIVIAEAGGKAVSPPAPPPWPSILVPGGCVNGCEGDVDKHHFPVGRTGSCDEAGDWTIPLCRRCHTEYHQEPKEWTWTYRKNWMRYLVNR